MISDRQQTLEKADIQICSAGITLKKVYRNRLAEERRQLSLLVSHDNTWQMHRSSSLHAFGVCIYNNNKIYLKSNIHKMFSRLCSYYWSCNRL